MGLIKVKSGGVTRFIKEDDVTDAKNRGWKVIKDSQAFSGKMGIEQTPEFKRAVLAYLKSIESETVADEGGIPPHKHTLLATDAEPVTPEIPAAELPEISAPAPVAPLTLATGANAAKPKAKP